MIDTWGDLRAMIWLSAAAAVLYAYVAYWFWKFHRVRHIDALLGRIATTDGGDPRRANFLVFDAITVLVGGAYVAVIAIGIRALNQSGLDVGVQLAATWLAMLGLAGVCAGVLTIVARSTLGVPPGESAMSAMVALRSGRKQVARFALAFVALNLVVVGLMRPQGEPRQREVKRRGVDIVFAIDLSKSMLADDVKPNRIEAAKSEIDQVMRRLKGDRVALVAFTSVSFTQSPLTSDYGAIRVYLDQIRPQLMPYGGTAVGRAVLDGVELLTGESFLERGRAGRTEDGGRPDHDQIIVVFTDGEDHESNPVKAAEEAYRHGIRVYTVGFGSETGTPVPDFDDDGTPNGYVVRNGEQVLTRLDETSLREVADASGGEYLRYEGQGSIAEPLVDEIDKLEKAELSSLLTENREDYFYVVLLPALLLLLMASFFGDRKGIHLPFAMTDPLERERQFRRHKRGRKPSRKRRRRKSGAAAAIVLGCSLWGCADDGTGLLERKNPNVEQGNEAFADEEWEGALEAYAQAREALPDDPMLDYNIGITHLEAGHYEQAREALVNALAVKPDRDGGEALFQVHFGLGNAYYHLGVESEQKALPADDPVAPDVTEPALADPAMSREARLRFREALNYYKRALEHDPSDEDVRYNLELALFKLFPPCNRFEDSFENNDKAAEAALAMDAEQLAALQAARLTICAGDADYFQLEAGAGFKVSVDATFEPLAREELMDDSARLDFARISLALVTEDGEVLVSDEGAEPPTSRPPVPPQRTTRRIDTFEIPDTVSEEGPVYLRVTAEDAAEAHYQVAVKLIPPCGRFEDQFEDNDVREAAAGLETGLHDVRICPADDDWYTFETKPGDSVFLDLLPMANEETGLTPQLEFELYAESEAKPIRIGRIDPADRNPAQMLNFEVFEWPRSDTFHLRIRGFGDDARQEGPYAMDFHHFPPCPLGDDDFEDNDTPSTSAELPTDERLFRYLRHCSEDEDWYIAKATRPQAQPGTGPAPSGTGERIGFQATIEYDPRFGDLGLTAFDPVTSEVLAEGEVAKSSTPGKQVKSLSLDGALDGERIQLRVAGDPAFYHLLLSTPDENQSDNEDQEPPPEDQQEDESQEGEEPEDQEDGQDEPQDSGEDEDEEQEGENPQDGDDQAQDATPESGQGDDSQVDEVPGQDQVDRDTGKPLSPEELKDRRINDLLDRLERSDPNLPLERAREDQPDRIIENDW